MPVRTIKRGKGLMRNIRTAAIALTLLTVISAISGCNSTADSNGSSQPVSISEAPQETSDTGSLIDSTVNSVQTTPAPASEETTAVTTVATTAATTTTPPQTTKPAPEWTETKASGKMYLAVSCYSRKKALLGAETVKLYNINDIVTVTAITDTGYYKIKDGTFIHSDYLSKEKVVIQTTAATTTTATTTPKPVATKKPEKDKKPDKNSKYVSSGYEPLDDIIFPILDSIITGKQTDTQKLKAIYDYLIKYSYTERVVLIPQSLSEYSEQLYAISLFEKGYGVCYDFTSAFKYMSRAIGFDTRMIYGRHTNPSGGSSEHTWAELDINGTTYIFDPAIEKLIGPNARSRFMRTYGEIGQYYIFV